MAIGFFLAFPNQPLTVGPYAEFFGDCGETPAFGLDDYVIQVTENSTWLADSADAKYWYFGGFCQAHHAHGKLRFV